MEDQPLRTAAVINDPADFRTRVLTNRRSTSNSRGNLNLENQLHLLPTGVSGMRARPASSTFWLPDRRALAKCSPVRRSRTSSLGRSGIGVGLAVAAGEVWQTSYQFHGQGLRARRAGSRPSSAACRAFLQDEMGSIRSSAVDATVQHEVTLRVVTD